MQNSKFSPHPITVQFIDVENGFHLWSEKYDRVLNDVFEMQDEIGVPSSKS
jgi:TolB-like protein